MRASRIGPRSERRPTPAREGGLTVKDKSGAPARHSPLPALLQCLTLDHDRITTSDGRSPMAHLWPVLFYVPAVLLLLASLSFITAMMDRRERRKAGR
jgi:hypothetical protein